MKESAHKDFVFDELHKPPKGYTYEVTEFKHQLVAIWICNHYKFVYNGGNPTRSIWGFWCSKTGKYYAPINSKTIGKEVRIEDTTPYSAMVIKRTPLELAFL